MRQIVHVLIKDNQMKQGTVVKGDFKSFILGCFEISNSSEEEQLIKNEALSLTESKLKA